MRQENPVMKCGPLFCLILFVLQSGCQFVEFNPPGGSKSAGATNVSWLPTGHNLADLIDFSEWLYRQPPQSLYPVYKQALEAERSDSSPESKVTLALVISVPGTAFKDYRQALGLLDDAAGSGSGTSKSTHNFIRLQKNNVLMLLREQQQTGGEVANYKKQIETLQYQLNELKTIEKGLIERQEEFD